MQTTFDHNGKPNSSAVHDLGAASANLTAEATNRKLSVHQMAGIKPERIIEVFALPDNIRPVTGLALGYHGNNPALDEALASRDQNPRERKAASEFLIHGAGEMQ